MTAPATESSAALPRFWRAELDLLRLVAFLAVFLNHALPQDAGRFLRAGLSPGIAMILVEVSTAGGLGVDLFFCLSAYLITEILRREHERRGRIDLAAFWARRCLRIWPLYFAFLLFAVFISPRMVPGDALPRDYLGAFLVFGGNWICAFRGYPGSVAAPLWSVSIEEQFYLAWPLLLVASRFLRARLLALGVALTLVAWTARIWLVRQGASHPAIWCNSFARLDPIVCGALLSLFLAGKVPRIKLSIRVALALAAMAALVAAGGSGAFAGPMALVTYPLASLACLALLVAFLGAEVPSSPMFQVLTFLGRISYGLYVFHAFAIRLADRTGFPLEVRMAVGLGITLVLALASWFVLESPCLRLKRRFARA